MKAYLQCGKVVLKKTNKIYITQWRIYLSVYKQKIGILFWVNSSLLDIVNKTEANNCDFNRTKLFVVIFSS